VTESEWLACTDPQPMLDFLRGKVSDRKLRLFAAACCRMIWHLLVDERSQKAIELLERYADGLATDSELSAAAQDAHRAAEDGDSADNPYAGWTAANAVGAGQVDDDDEDPDEGCAADALRDAKDTAFSAAWAIGHHFHPDDSGDAWHAKTKAHEAAECDLLRHVVGNPFRRAAVDPAWLAWNGGTVRTMAQGIYDERAFDRLPVLADALEEAGCTDTDILAHCRQPGPHVRGCWVVDLLLGKA
jgi:hypothetical protein